MGGWGTGSFENDDALDWLAAFSEAPSVMAIKEALTTVTEMDSEDYLELPQACSALAAAEIVAAIAGRPGSDLPEEISGWIGEQKTIAEPGLIPLAQKAVAQVKSNSELNDNWIEEDSGQEWYKVVLELEARLEHTAT